MEVMKKIVIKDNFAFLYLNVGFYDENIISKSIEVYKSFIKVVFKKTKKYYILKINKIINDLRLEDKNNQKTKNKIVNNNENEDEYNLEVLCNEFLNYILYINKHNN